MHPAPWPSAAYDVRKISGVTQGIDLPGDHPPVGRFVPDLWLTDGSRPVDHGHGGGFLLLGVLRDRRCMHPNEPLPRYG
jgi:hypothetical protein